MTSTPTENRGQHERPQPIHEVPPELDESGAPYYIWPPFPRPAPGVEIIPFKDFTPKGIQIRMDLDDDDGVEYDGEGIPTVTLRVKHSSGKPNVDGERPKKKRKNKSKGKKANGGATRTDLWKEWQEGEDLRSKYRYDLQVYVSSILSVGVSDEFFIFYIQSLGICQIMAFRQLGGYHAKTALSAHPRTLSAVALGVQKSANYMTRCVGHSVWKISF